MGNQARQIQSTTNSHSLGDETHKRILAIDDDPNIAKLIEEALHEKTVGDLTMHCNALTSSQEATELLKTKHYDLILLDLVMPHLDGRQILKEIKEKSDSPNHTTPVIVISGNMDRVAPLIPNNVLQGVTFFEKPLDMDRLKRMCALQMAQPQTTKKKKKSKIQLFKKP